MATGSSGLVSPSQRHFDWLPWLLVAAAIIHITEEFLWPGGFMKWFQRYHGPSAKTITPRFLIIVNLVLVGACVNAALSVTEPIGAAYWLAMCALVASNGLWHAWAAAKSHTYSPGMITGLFVYVPLAVYGYVHFVRSGFVSVTAAVVALAIGGSYPFWDALYHAPRKEPA